MIVCCGCEQKKVLGFHFLKKHESPAHVAQILLHRFSRDRLQRLIVVYDNACHLHRWCYKREPGLFARVQFLIDRLHWWNHVGCQLTLDMHSFKFSAHIIAINSEAVEQVNNTLRKRRSSISQMTMHNAVEDLREFFWRANASRARRPGR